MNARTNSITPLTESDFRVIENELKRCIIEVSKHYKINIDYYRVGREFEFANWLKKVMSYVSDGFVEQQHDIWHGETTAVSDVFAGIKSIVDSEWQRRLIDGDTQTH